MVLFSLTTLSIKFRRFVRQRVSFSSFSFLSLRIPKFPVRRQGLRSLSALHRPTHHIQTAYICCVFYHYVKIFNSAAYFALFAGFVVRCYFFNFLPRVKRPLRRKKAFFALKVFSPPKSIANCNPNADVGYHDVFGILPKPRGIKKEIKPSKAEYCNKH